MIRAAGVMYVADGRILFLKRAPRGDHPLEWCLPGGGVYDGESLEECARREFYEETGRELKQKRACGGTVKDGIIILQGDHTRRVKALLVASGYPAANITVLEGLQ